MDSMKLLGLLLSALGVILKLGAELWTLDREE
jgi:hypothetical protein